MTLGRVISAGNLVARIVFRDDTSGIARSNRRLANLRYNLERAAHASRNLGIAITGVSVLGVREWAKVETAQSKLIGQVGLLREEVEGPIADSIRNLGTLYGQTEAEGTEAFFKVASAQFGVVKSQEILEVSSRAAAAEFGSLNDITSLLISGLNSFPDTNAVIYMDQLSESVRLGNLNAGELTRTLPVIQSQTASLGISTSTLFGLYSELSQVQPNLRRNTTGLQAIFRAFTNTIERTRFILDGLGIDTTDIAGRIRKDFVGLLAEINNAAEGSQEVLADLFDQRGLTTFINLTARAGDDLSRLNSTIADIENSTGALDKTFEAFEGNAALELRKTMAQVRNTLSDLGREVFPLVQAGLNAILPPIRGFTSALERGDRWAVALARGLPLIGAGLLAISVILPGIAVALGAIGALTLPWALAITGIVVAVSALVLYWDEIYNIISKIARTFGLGFLFGGSTPDVSTQAVNAPIAQPLAGSTVTNSNVTNAPVTNNVTINAQGANAQEVVDIFNDQTARQDQALINDTQTGRIN